MVRFMTVVFILATVYRSYSKRIPLIILGVDGYAYQAYEKFKNKTDENFLAFPIKPVFPSATFPNFLSIATGLYPTQHGIINNKFLNKDKNATFLFNNLQHDQFDWFRGEPIWITAKKSGLRVYTDMWIGASASYSGIKPDFYSLFNPTKTFQQKTKDLISNIDDEKTRCDLYMVYSNEPDRSLHVTRLSDRAEVERIHNMVEEQISQLLSSLGDRDYNIIVVSDHGMASFEERFSLSKELEDRAQLFIGGPFGMWYIREGDEIENVVEDLNEYLVDNGMEGVVATDTASLPSRFNLCGLEKEGLPEIVLMVDNEAMVQNQYPSHFKSGHGYDNELPEMQGHVRVHGPGFNEKAKTGHMTDHVVMNTELYNLFCSLLRIHPADNTGNLKTFDFLLVEPPNWELSYTQLSEPCSKEGQQDDLRKDDSQSICDGERNES
ncbi:ectonucleotide pyrophosphatase/phosphodiesterase family member 3-like [Bolinopsis microptera]|uniref:ectonucleotide pyrophosphatase/phosphodiesterase family member 3-like n=1 Tax=Bolinopsis microptera TaxID=2820187 RepID=UPI003078E270